MKHKKIDSWYLIRLRKGEKLIKKFKEGGPMNKSRTLLLAIGLAILLGFHCAYGQDDLKIWKEFVAAVKAGKMTLDKIRPHEGISKEGLLKQLTDLKGAHDRYNSWKEWEAPEVFPVGDQVSFLVTFTWGGQTKSDFLFTFLKEGDQWYYRHEENIQIRLDRVTKLPASEFPDLPQETKAWQREELYWSQMVGFYNVLSRDKGKDYFLNLLRDGMGYFLAAKVWVPFVPPQRAFILYLCWEQSRLRENHVILEKLTDQEAVVKLQTHFFFLYKRTGHLKEQISFEDYRRIFEAIWQDRAFNAGWNLEIKYEDPECLKCVFHFTRKS